MFLISQTSLKPFKSYHPQSVLTRPDSLPHLFFKFRIYQNLTKKALSRKIGFCEEHISKIESGQMIPSMDYTILCAQEFGINPEWIKRKWLRAMMLRIEERLRRKYSIEN